jgi:hypothetical protein
VDFGEAREARHRCVIEHVEVVLGASHTPGLVKRDFGVAEAGLGNHAAKIRTRVAKFPQHLSQPLASSL